jgi:hypothetical protein
VATYHFSIKSGKKGKAANHAAYITRQGKHGKPDEKSDLIASAHGNLPAWACDDPTTYWKAADKHERANGATYREFELALPKELTREQQLALTMRFLEQEISAKPFQVVIHAPTASLGGAVQPHAHAMYSDRIDDGIERVPEQHFRRFNAKNPEQGGCRKDSGGKNRIELREELKRLRERWAHVQNEALEAHGHATRVDHRSNCERGIERAPERHLGHLGIKKMSLESRQEFIKSRSDNGAQNRDLRAL